MFEILVISLIIFLLASQRAKRGFRKGLGDTIETSSFLVLKGNQFCRSELSANFDAEFAQLLEETPKARNQHK